LSNLIMNSIQNQYILELSCNVQDTILRTIEAGEPRLPKAVETSSGMIYFF
jgi:hypothetical protein